MPKKQLSMIIGENIKKLIDERNEIDKCSGKILSEYIGCDYKRFRNAVNGDCEFKATEIKEIADYFNVSTDKIYTGIEEKNRTIAADLGLSDEAIEQLKGLNSLEKGKHNAKVLIDESFFGGVESEGISPEESIIMINKLLTTNAGMNLLTLLYRYCCTDFSESYVDNEECTEITFKNDSHVDGETIVTASLMRFALYKGIENVIDDLRSNMM